MSKGERQNRESLSDAKAQNEPRALAVHLFCVSLSVSSFLQWGVRKRS